MRGGRIGRLLRAGAGSLWIVGGAAMLQTIVVAGLVIFNHGRPQGAALFALWLIPIASGVLLAVASVALYRIVLQPAQGSAARLAARFHALYDSNADMVAYYDRTGAMLHANPAAAQAFGNDPAFVGKSFEQHVTTSEGAASALYLTRALKGLTSSFETVFVRSDGSTLPVIATLQPVTVDGEVVGVYGIAKDATNIRDAQNALRRSERQFRSIFERQHDAVAILDDRGCFVRVNSAMVRVSGYPADELTGTPAARVLPGVDPVGEAKEYDVPLLRKDGTLCDCHVHVLPMLDDGVGCGTIAFIEDRSQQHALEQRLAELDGRMRSLYVVASSSAPDPKEQIDEALALGRQALSLQAAFVTQVAANVVTIRYRSGEGDDLAAGSSLPLAHSVGRRMLGVQSAVAVHDLTVEPWAGELARAKLSWKSFIGTSIMVDGAPYGTLAFAGAEVRNKPFEQSDLDFIDLMSTVVGSALLREQRQSEMRELAYRDPLTGLANRALFEEHVQRAIALARRSNDQFILHFIDLDRFKPVNDTYGHAAGDEVLCEIAKRLREAVRDQDVVARVGGDEFLVLQGGISMDGAMRAMARRLARSVNEPIVLADGTTVTVGASLGMAVYPTDAQDAPALLRFADADMYRAKELSRNGVRSIG